MKNLLASICLVCLFMCMVSCEKENVSPNGIGDNVAQKTTSTTNARLIDAGMCNDLIMVGEVGTIVSLGSDLGIEVQGGIGVVNPTSRTAASTIYLPLNTSTLSIAVGQSVTFNARGIAIASTERWRAMPVFVTDLTVN